jgi:hypothetical protein
LATVRCWERRRSRSCKRSPTLEANILAYNDTYLLTAGIAAATLVWILWRLLRLRITARMALKNATGNK